MEFLRKPAEVLAYIFHPLNIPLIGIALLCYTPSIPKSFLVLHSFYLTHPEIKRMLLVLFAIFTWIAPLVATFLLKRSGDIESFQMERREERNLPLGFMIFFFMIFFALLYFYIPENILPSSVYAILLGGFVGLIAVRWVNNTMKISLHATGMGMLSGAIYSYYLSSMVYPIWMMPTLFIVSGIVLSSRIFLGKHDLKQVLYGYGIGFLTQLLCALLFF